MDTEKIDANSYAQKYGEDALRDETNNLIDEALDELPALEAEAAEAQAADDDKKIAEYVFKTIKGNSDLANARRLIFVQNGKLRYAKDVDKFSFYDEGKNIWELGSNQNSSVYPLVVDTAEKLTNLAKTDNERKIATAFCQHKKYSPCVSTLKGCREIIVTRADFDNHPNLLNCQNCVVDLESGKLYKAAPEVSKFLLTQQTNANYLPNWRSNPAEVVEKFLRDVLPNDDIRAFLINWLGYSLTAEVNEEKFVLMQGGGGNGKGTLTNTLVQIGGSYFVSFPIQGILWNKFKDVNAATPAYTILEKARLAIAEEIPPGAKVDPAQLKLLTGGDRFYVRNLREEGRFVNPTAKLMLSGNNALIFPDAKDFGIQRRLVAILFEQDFRNNPNIHLKEELLEQAAKDYLLSMLIDAAQDWYKHGLQIPSILKTTSKEYLASQDFVADFIAEYCEYDSDKMIPRQEFVNKLRDCYPRETPNNQKALSELLEKIEGITYKRDKCGYKLYGLKWRD